MPQRLIIFDNPEDPGNPLVLYREVIDAAAKDPVAIGKLMVDQAWAEGADPTGGALYYDRRTNRHRRLQPLETGHEDFMTSGCVRVLVSAEQRQRDRAGMERAAWCSCWWSSSIGTGGHRARKPERCAPQSPGYPKAPLPALSSLGPA